MLKQYYRCQIDFTGKSAGISAGFMGLALFLKMFFYFGVSDISAVSAGEWIFLLILPGILCMAYIALLQIFKWNAPGLFGILGALFCLIFLSETFFTGNILRIILGCVWYLLCGVSFLAAAGGFLPNKGFASVLLCGVIVVRLIAFDIGKLSFPQWIAEWGTLCCQISLMFLPSAMKTGNHIKE